VSQGAQQFGDQLGNARHQAAGRARVERQRAHQVQKVLFDV
jgi:hypothetical protein